MAAHDNRARRSPRGCHDGQSRLRDISAPNGQRLTSEARFWVAKKPPRSSWDRSRTALVFDRLRRHELNDGQFRLPPWKALATGDSQKTIKMIERTGEASAESDQKRKMSRQNSPGVRAARVSNYLAFMAESSPLVELFPRPCTNPKPLGAYSYYPTLGGGSFPAIHAGRRDVLFSGLPAMDDHRISYLVCGLPLSQPTVMTGSRKYSTALHLKAPACSFWHNHGLFGMRLGDG